MRLLANYIEVKALTRPEINYHAERTRVRAHSLSAFQRTAIRIETMG
jgi:hypothetical protein